MLPLYQFLCQKVERSDWKSFLSATRSLMNSVRIALPFVPLVRREKMAASNAKIDLGYEFMDTYSMYFSFLVHLFTISLVILQFADTMESGTARQNLQFVAIGRPARNLEFKERHCIDLSTLNYS